MKKTQQIRIFPTHNQEIDLLNLSTIRNEIWNTLLNIQESSYNTSKKKKYFLDLI